MKKLAGILVTALAVVALATAAEQTGPSGDLKTILASMQKQMADSRSVYLEFKQERILKLFTDPLVSEGVMLLDRPDQIRWETTSPYQTILLGSQKSVAQFEFADGKWDKLNLGFPQMLQRVMHQMSAMNQGKLDAMTEDFNITVTTNGGPVLTMVPKNENVREVMTSLEIRLTQDLTSTREVLMNEPNGDLTRITFQNEMHNVTFPPRTFDQNKPLPVAEVKAAVKHAP